uniref:Uncharacterized protein n=1 Tax=Arion vulgaris TaxID=1028688 RepID=A0A0B6YWZ8_9EUPU
MMNHLMIKCAVLLIAFGSVTTISDLSIVKEYCEIILGQSQHDTSQCYEKPNSYMRDKSDKAIMIYLCCLGYFMDVSINYIPYLDEDFLVYLLELTNDRNLINIARFVVTCKSEDYLLFKTDFLHWNQTGRVVHECRAR